MRAHSSGDREAALVAENACRAESLQPRGSPAASTLRAIAQRRSPSKCTGFRVGAEAGYPHRRRCRRSLARRRDAIHVRESFAQDVHRAKRAVFVEIAFPIYSAREPLAESGLRFDEPAVTSRRQRFSVRQRRKREAASHRLVHRTGGALRTVFRVVEISRIEIEVLVGQWLSRRAARHDRPAVAESENRGRRPPRMARARSCARAHRCKTQDVESLRRADIHNACRSG